MSPKFGNSSISMREVIITSILTKFDQKKQFFMSGSWFKFNNLGLTQGMALEFCICVEKGLKLKVRKFLGTREGLIPMFAEVTGKKQVGGEGVPPS